MISRLTHNFSRASDGVFIVVIEFIQNNQNMEKVVCPDPVHML